MTPMLGIMASAITGNLVTSSYESIATATGTGASGTITFSSIPATYKHLQIRGMGFGNSGGQLFLRLNGDTASNYTRHRIVGYSSVVYASGETAQTSIRMCVDDINYASMGTTNPTVAITDIVDYASTTKYKTVKTLGGIESNNAGNGEIDLTSGLWLSTSVITSVSVIISAGSFTTDTVFSLYGIKGA
jgi:hypothetical protein